MGLTSSDLYEIRKAIKEEVNEGLKPIKGELESLRNDIKEIYYMLAHLGKRVTSFEKKILPDKQFEKLTLEQKILKLNSELITAAKQAGITLPR